MQSRASLRVLIVTALVVLALPAFVLAQTPQTITLDGVNDFDAANLLDADGGDTEHAPLDIGDVYVTNDAGNLYVGFDHDRGGWGSIQLGIAIDVNTADGGTADPWGRAIEWSLAANKPDFMFYVNLDNNWQAGYSWNTGTGTWDDIGSGPGALSWQAGTTFKELGLLLGTLGLSASDVMNIEIWTTQDGATKGPLDAAANDASQLSVPGLTIWDTPSPIPMFDYLGYIVQAAADPDPPVVTGALHLVDSQVRVTFNESVDPTTATVAGNYSVSGASVVSAAIGASPNIVVLTLGADIGPSASLYTVTVTGVKDLAGNTIGAGNTACFMVKNVLFRGRMSQFLASQTPPFGSFTVEGSPSPLTWALCDGMSGVDAGGDVYEIAADFCFAGDCGLGTAEATMEYKWVYDCATYEPLGSNRTHTMSLATGAADTLDVWWNDQDPTQFTAHDIDVEFFLDMSLFAPTALDSVSINGSVLPLNWNVPPETQLVDDGTGNDAAAGDMIFSSVIRFPAGTEKNFTYKFLLNSDYECSTQGDRSVFLNDALFDIVGGALGPLTLPVVHFDACDVTWRGVEVVFSVDTNGTSYGPLGPADVVSVNGTPHNTAVPAFDWTVPSLNPMADDGIAPDATAGDGIYTVSVVFPDSSQIYTDYKYLLNDAYECSDQGNRTLQIDADNYDDLGNPQVLATDALHQCHSTGADDAPALRFALHANHPNPFNPKTDIRFTLHRDGVGSLRIYNVQGELVRTLAEGPMAAGEHVVSWEGSTQSGSRAPSGVYFYKLELSGRSETRKMVLLK